jgi:hypothetical protein
MVARSECAFAEVGEADGKRDRGEGRVTAVSALHHSNALLPM